MDDVLLRPPPARARFPAVHLALFLATVGTTLWAGFWLSPLAPLGPSVARVLQGGLPFAAALVAILFSHEMGHYVLARRHRVDTTLPYFIPVPFGAGTLGAVIRIRSALPSRRATLEIGAAGPIAGFLVAVPLLERIGADVVPLYCISDGTFPNHHPDPVVDENLFDLIGRVREEEAELGIAFDGDADRIGVVDETGEIVRGDILLLIFGLDILKRRGPGQKMVFDVKCSQAVPEVFAAAGGKPIMWKTGHSLMKEKMKLENAPIAGELSGHICIGDDYYGFDDALYDGCRLIDLVARSSRPLSAQVAEFPKYVSTPEIRIDVPEERKFGIVADAVAHFRERYDVIDVDGVRVLFEGGWGLLRASNTQPVLVARYEACTAERLAEIHAEMERWLRDQGVRV